MDSAVQTSSSYPCECKYVLLIRSRLLSMLYICRYAMAACKVSSVWSVTVWTLGSVLLAFQVPQPPHTPRVFDGRLICEEVD